MQFFSSSSFNVKTPSNSDKTAATAASTLAARLTVAASSSSSLSDSGSKDLLTTLQIGAFHDVCGRFQTWDLSGAATLHT